MIEFIDRPLKANEQSHYRCSKCGAWLNSDIAYSHKCNPVLLKLKRSCYNKYENRSKNK